MPGVFGAIHNKRRTKFWTPTTRMSGSAVPTNPVIRALAAENTAGAAGALGVLFLAINGVFLLVFIHELDIIVVEKLRHNLAGVFPFPAFLHQLL